MSQPTRHRSAEVAVGFAADEAGRAIAYATIATGTGRTLARIPFTVLRFAALEGRELAYGAVTAVAAYLRARGFTRVRLRVNHSSAAGELSGRDAVPPALAMAYVKARCVLHSFAVARVERAEPVETHELEARARAEVGEHAPAAA